MRIRSLLLMVAALACVAHAARADDKQKGDKSPQVYPAAVLPFRERGSEVKGFGSKVTDLLFAKLSADPSLTLVDREDIQKVLGEQAANLSGLVNPDQATKIGQLTGAKLLVTGSVMQIDHSVYIVAKVMGTETSRVVGASAKGSVRDDLDKLVDDLSKDISKQIAARSDELVAKPATRDDRIAAMKRKLGKRKLPAVLIEIPEYHVGHVTADPAAETEVTLYSTEAGFKVIDPKQGRKRDADILIKGEAFSEQAVRLGELISVKARLELKAIDQVTGRIVAIDRQTTVAVDLTEQIAAKNALQEAGAAVAERLLPKIATPEKGKDAGQKKHK